MINSQLNIKKNSIDIKLYTGRNIHMQILIEN